MYPAANARTVRTAGRHRRVGEDQRSREDHSETWEDIVERHSTDSGGFGRGQNMAWDCRRDIEKCKKMSCYFFHHKRSIVASLPLSTSALEPRGCRQPKPRRRAEPIKAERPVAGARDSRSSRSGPLFIKILGLAIVHYNCTIESQVRFHRYMLTSISLSERSCNVERFALIEIATFNGLISTPNCCRTVFH